LDPVGYTGGDHNLYSYVQNSPLKFVDPSGLKQQCSNPDEENKWDFNPKKETPNDFYDRVVRESERLRSNYVKLPPKYLNNPEMITTVSWVQDPSFYIPQVMMENFDSSITSYTPAPLMDGLYPADTTWVKVTPAPRLVVTQTLVNVQTINPAWVAALNDLKLLKKIWKTAAILHDFPGTPDNIRERNGKNQEIILEHLKQ
jgi:hypothetical protein